MEGFLKIIKKNNIDINIEPMLELLQNYKRTNHFTYTRKNNEIISIYFTNEFDNYTYKVSDFELFTPVGNFVTDKEQVKRYISTSNWESVASLQGSFAIGYTDLEKRKVTIVTHVARVENVFLYEDNDKIIVGTDPLLVSIQSNEKFIPQFQPENYYTFIQNGYYTDDSTPFEGVKSLPPNKIVEIQKGEVRLRDVDNSLKEFLNKDKKDIDFDQLTEVFLKGFNTNKESAERLALTGGKDSRLIFAAMKELGYEFSVFTNGFEDNPDIIISKMIAEKYELVHDTITPKISDDNTITVNPFNRMLNTMIGSSGLIYGYDSVNISPKGFQGNRTFDGVGAGLVKGGYSAFNNLKNKDRIINNFTRNDQLFLKSGKDKYISNFEQSLGLDLTPNQYNMLSFLNYRTGRWTANAKLGKNYTKNQHSPFIDNLFTKLFLQLNYADINSETIVYEIMRRLDKELIEIPFAKDRWKFERQHPVSVSGYNNWLKRKELYPKTLLGNYNWRNIHNNDVKLVEYFRDLILSHKNSNVFDVLDYKLIENIFEGKIKPQDNKILWSIASKIIFVDHFKNTGIKFKNKQIDLKIPGTTVTNTDNQIKLIDYTHNMYPINDTLQVNEFNEVTVMNLEKNRYLNSHKGKFNQIPDSKIVSDNKKITLAANIGAENKSKIEIILVLYDENEKVKNLKFEPIYNEHKETFIWTESISLPSNIKRLRPLILFKDKEKNKKYKLNYINLKI